MTYFVKFNPETGHILYSGDVPSSMLDLQGDNILITEGNVTNQSHYVRYGNLVPIPPRPSKSMKFDYFTESWKDPRTLQELKDSKWEEIKKHRSEAEMAPFSYNDMVFDGDLNAQRRLNNYASASRTVLLSNAKYSVDFTLADNSVVTLTAQDFIDVEMARIQVIADVFTKATNLRDQINSANTPLEVSQITW